MRWSNKWKWAIPLLVAGGLAVMRCGAADPAPKGFVVHEWGTFSTFSGSDGKDLVFQPYDNDLPPFVHGYLPHNSKEGPRGGTISLETPVLYFYSDVQRIASVRVGFPKGTFTEWYPLADRTEQSLAWQGVEVLAGEEVKLPKDDAKSRYYAARETDADPLRVTSTDDKRAGAEQEKFLFYRGVGTFDMPLTVRAWGGGKFTATWDGQGPWGGLILVRVEDGKIRFKSFRLERRPNGAMQTDVRLPDRDASAEDLSEAMVQMLTEKGLYEKESRAMVKTWKSAWFGEEGTRVLYVLPEAVSDELLPLRVEPKPDALLRVLVGRHDVLTPEREKHIDACVAKLIDAPSNDKPEQKAAEAELTKLGRYEGAAWQEAGARLKHQR
jgi:hypothetical protein